VILLFTAVVLVLTQTTFRQQHCSNNQCSQTDTTCVTNLTLPCGTCIPCNPSASAICVTAMVQCHQPSNETMQEALYLTASCTGTPYKTIQPDLYTPSTSYCYKWGDFWVHNVCPDASDEINIDLSRFVPKLLKDRSEKFNSEALVWSAVFEYKRFLLLKLRYPGLEFAPSSFVDEVWHMHILDTRQYMKDCERLFGRYIHHMPSFGTGEEEENELGATYKETLEVYEKVFGESAPTYVWPRINSASCAGCTGCSTQCFLPACSS